MSLTQFRVDDEPHAMDGLRLRARDGSKSVERSGGRQSLFRDQYNALAKLNLAAIERIVSAKYQRGAACNRQHPFVEVLVSDIQDSGETLDLSELAREALPPAFRRMN